MFPGLNWTREISYLRLLTILPPITFLQTAGDLVMVRCTGRAHGVDAADQRLRVALQDQVTRLWVTKAGGLRIVAPRNRLHRRVSVVFVVCSPAGAAYQ